MDLVSSYLSDEEMGSHKKQRTMQKSKKDKNSGEESDIDVIYESTSSSVVKKQTPTDVDIECICLDDSDTDNIEVKKEVEKQIDYLNLESSSSDDEQENIQNSVNNLLNSAAILNDLECGPTKPVTEPEVMVTSPSCPKDIPVIDKKSHSPTLPIKDHDDNSTASSTTDICKKGDNKIHYEEDFSNKKIKLDQSTTKCKTIDIVTSEGLDPKMWIYRKDERIIAAYKKKHISHIPSILSQTVTAHESVISSLSWCAVPYSHLLLSSSLDRTVKIWDVYSQNKPTQILPFSFSVRAAKWSKNGEQIIAGGFGKEAYVIDALSGTTHVTYKIHNHISSIAIHPFIEDILLFGTKDAILGFDVRVNTSLPVRTFLSKCGEVLDIAFLNKDEFICSTNVVSHDSADRTIMVWDFNSGAIMSNQIFLERYTCPSLKIHPLGSSFIAQTNGDYIASFSSQRPYKRKKNTYIGHKVSGFGIECEFSPDGQYVASGDAKGDVYFYKYADATEVNKLSIKPDVAANKLQWHPVLSSTMAVATWDGEIHFYK